MGGEKLDWFLATIFTGEASLSDADKDLIASQAELFLRARGSINWSEWQLLSPLSRIAFQLAADRLENERSARIASMVVSDLIEASKPKEAAGGQS